jgi:hypothetical protein
MLALGRKVPLLRETRGAMVMRMGIVLVLGGLLAGCGEEFRRNQEAWMRYRNSPAYHQ